MLFRSAYVGYSYMGLLLLSTMTMAALEIPRLIALSRIEPPDPQRRLLLQRGFALGGAALSAAFGGLALWGGLRRVAVKEVAVRLPRLPAGLDQLRVVQLTDVHIGPTLHGPWLRQVVAQVNALEPDIVAITGDLVDGSVASLREHVAPLRDLRARHGVYFVTGNHEYYAGVDEWLAEISRLGIRVLRNQHVTLTVGRDGAGKPVEIDLAGVDDYHADRFPGHGPDLPKALAGRDPQRPVILLAHQPIAVKEAATLGVDLQLSGHTHGGQIWPWRYLVYLQQPYVDGLHLLTGAAGPTQLYVSRGTGYWGPPMRLHAPAEITHLTLRPGTATV